MLADEVRKPHGRPLFLEAGGNAARAPLGLNFYPRLKLPPEAESACGITAGSSFYSSGACSGGAVDSRSTPLISAPKIRVVALMYRNTSVATTLAKLP